MPLTPVEVLVHLRRLLDMATGGRKTVACDEPKFWSNNYKGQRSHLFQQQLIVNVTIFKKLVQVVQVALYASCAF